MGKMMVDNNLMSSNTYITLNNSEPLNGSGTGCYLHELEEYQKKACNLQQTYN